MSEEFDIQSVWKKSKKSTDVSTFLIETLEKKGTKTTMYWIKVVLWIEFWMNLILLPIIIPYLIRKEEPTWYIGIYVGVTIIYFIYYQFLIRQINRFNYDGNVIHSLKKVYGYLRFFLLHYKVVIWFSMIFGLIYGFVAPENQEALSGLQTTKQWIIAIGFSTLIVAVVGGLMHLLVHLIYGRKIKRLKRMVRDLESEE
ncbi:hypothetical protein [Ekhidna sp.]|uniref:hypothetical protein n=1 Tax=Ekhidna sp. TaxID=2608089 RepID=UPI003B50920B